MSKQTSQTNLSGEIVDALGQTQKQKEEKRKMVKRTKKEFEQVEAFDGICETVEYLDGEFQGRETKQIHMAIKPLDAKTIELIKESKTKQMHNYINLSEGTTETEVSEGSNLDKYLIEVETVFPQAKKTDKIIDALNLMKGKKVHYVYKKLGKAYKGYEGKSYYVPQRVL